MQDTIVQNTPLKAQEYPSSPSEYNCPTQGNREVCEGYRYFDSPYEGIGFHASKEGLESDEEDMIYWIDIGPYKPFWADRE